LTVCSSPSSNRSIGPSSPISYGLSASCPPAQAGGSKLIGAGDEDGGNLRPGILGQAEGGEHHRQPNAALIAFAADQGYAVPTERIFEDEGYSGASLIRPGLERVRDLAAEGELDAVLVYAPDRLSRRYAYQILLIEELGSCRCRDLVYPLTTGDNS
jgi:hypothetical protein